MAAPAICSEGCDLLVPGILLDGRNGMEPSPTKVLTAGEGLSSHRVKQTLPLLQTQLIPATFTCNSIIPSTVRN